MLGLDFGGSRRSGARKRGAASLDGDLTDPGGIERLLERLREDRCTLSVGVPGSGRAHPSLVLGVDSKHDEVLIDEPNRAALAVDAPIEVKTWLEGIAIRFVTHVRSQDADRRLYRLDMPELVERRQRRAAHRAPVARDAAVFATLVVGDSILAGHVRDLSVIGMAFTVDGEEAWPGAETPVPCEVRLKDDATLACAFEVRRTASHGKTLLLAGRFVGLDGPGALALERFIAELEREALRRRAR